MKRLDCKQCGNNFPMNDMVQVLETGKCFCNPCAEQALQDKENPLEGQIKNLIDPTVCSFCNYDSGTSNLPLIAGLPSCTKCENYFKNRPFPNWIKASFAAVLLIVIFSVGWNLRFIKGYIEMKDSFKLLSQGNYILASAKMSSASGHVPESADLKILSDYVTGINLLVQDNPEKALEELRKCENKLPENYRVKDKILQAKIGVAFDSKDYDGFLRYAKALELRYPGDYMTKAMVASAYACKYAETGNDTFRQKSMKYLSQSKKAAGDNPSYKEYKERILHRLYTRKIITRDEFRKRFPNGWTHNKI